MKQTVRNTIKNHRKKQLIRLAVLLILAAAVCLCLKWGNIISDSDPTLSEVLESQRDPEIETILEEMTLEEKVGQMFMGCFYSGTPSPETVQQYHLGSVLFFRASFENTTKEEFQTALNAIDDSCSITPIAAVDEEGGSVLRISSNPEFRSAPFQSPRDLYQQGGMEAVLTETRERNQLLSQLGIDVNLAPVCDLSQNPSDFMYSRSLGQDVETTSDFVAETVKACLDDNIGCTLKHFPGYGNSTDTHTDLAVDTRSLKQLKTRDLKPFASGIQAGAPSVLISHNIVTAIDENLPASLSPAVHNLLRQDMDFDGVILTDDLSMAAIAEYYPDVDGAVLAVLAGNDLLCTGDFRDQYQAVLQAVSQGTISESRIDQSVRRILAWKKQLGLLEVTH